MTAILAPTIHGTIRVFRLIACPDLTQQGTYERRTQEGAHQRRAQQHHPSLSVMPYTL